MSLAPLVEAGPLIASHAAAAFAVIGIGAAQLAAKKGTRRHRVLGYLWVLLLAFVALGSFGIHTIRMWGPFSPIHILSVVTLISLLLAVGFARAGKIEAHRQTMLWVYALALILTGLFTLVPGRIMHRVVFGRLASEHHTERRVPSLAQAPALSLGSTDSPVTLR